MLLKEPSIAKEMLANPLPEVTHAARSRNVFGTLTTPPETKFNGTQEEQDRLLTVLKEHCPSIEKLILQQEKHTEDGPNKGNLHYHFLVCTQNPLFTTKLQALKAALSKFHPGRHDVQFAKSVKKVELYLFKDYKQREPYTEGYDEDAISLLHVKVDDVKPPPCRSANPNRYEAQLMQSLREFFLTNHYKINFYTRAVHGNDGLDHQPLKLRILYEKLERTTTIPKEYGSRGLDLIEKHIKDSKSYALPYFTPDRDYIGFNNVMYCFTEGKAYNREDPAMAGKAPIRHFAMDFPPPPPTAYLYLIKNHKWNRKDFMKHYGEMFKPKEHRDPCMYLWGPPLTGKSMFYIPLIEVFGDLVGNFTKDGKFSLSDLPDKLVAILDEVNIWKNEDMSLDLAKQLLEGSSFMVARKNKEPGLVDKIHTMVTCNVKPPDTLDKQGNRNYHVEAILSRIHPYETRTLEDKDENLARSIGKDHSPGWAVYCTQSEPYVVIPPEYL